MDEFVKYIGYGEHIRNPRTFADRPGVSTPMKMIWLSPNFVFTPAHEGTDYVTTFRHQFYDEYARQEMRKIGIPIVAGSEITKSQWEAAYDGLHYLRGANDNWNGCVANMVFQAVMNVVFPSCKAE